MGRRGSQLMAWTLLRGCHLVVGGRRHAVATKGLWELGLFLSSQDFRLYSALARWQEASHVFSKHRSAKSLRVSIISAIEKLRQRKQVIQLYQEMRQSPTQPDDSVFVAVLNSCTKTADLTSGRLVHADVIESGFESNVYVGSTLVDMYAKCGNLEDARTLFNKLPTKTVVTWNAMIAGYAQYGLTQEAMEIFRMMQQDSLTPATGVTFLPLLKACARTRDLQLGKEIHAQVRQRGLETDAFVGNSLVDMYAKCGSLKEARTVFYKLHSRDAVTYNTMIAGYVQHGAGYEALKCFESMQQEGVMADNYTYVSTLKACASIGAIQEGKRVHAQILKRGLQHDVFVNNALVHMYGECGTMHDAHVVFDALPSKNVVTWTAMIDGYARQGLGQEAINLFKSMQQDGIAANSVTFMSVLKACTVIGAIEEGKQIHFQILENGLEGDACVGNTLVDMYAKCGRLEDARSVFDRLPNRDVVTWSAMIAGYSSHGCAQQALDTYDSMHKDGVVPDNITFACALKACASTGSEQKGKQIHFQVLEKGLQAITIVGSSLVDMYAKCGNLVDARLVFDGLPRRDTRTWTAMIAGYAQHGLGGEALSLYDSMRVAGLAIDKVTYVSVVQACASIADISSGRKIHLQILSSGLESDISVGNSLVDMYTKCGDLKGARSVFDRLPIRDVVTWSMMIAANVQHGLDQEAIHLYETMDQDGLTPDVVTYVNILKACASIGAIHTGRQIHLEIATRHLELQGSLGNALVDMYARCGCLEDAVSIAERLPCQDVVTWSAIIGGYVRHGMGEAALNIYERMEQDAIAPDNLTFVSILKACAITRNLHMGRQVYDTILKSDLEQDSFVGNTLLDMFAKCGSLEGARMVFDRLHVKDVIGWSAMIAAYAEKGLGEEALNLYEVMQSEGMASANDVTFVGILKACGSIGAIQEGRRIHADITAKGLEANVIVGSALVDMYGKCGSLTDARMVFNRLPTKDVITWNALINAYGQHNNFKSARDCFEAMQQEGFKPDGATFKCLMIACSHLGLVREGQKYFKLMVEKHGIAPTIEHHNCLVDLLGRAGLLDDAKRVLETMPQKCDGIGWMSLLSACKSHGDLDRGRACFDQLVELEPQNAAGFAIMSKMYEDAERWEDADNIEHMRRTRGSQKKPAKAVIEVNTEVHEFAVGEKRDDLSSKLKSLNLHRSKQGHEPHIELVLRQRPEEDKEDMLCGHAEKLALAYGLLNTAEGTALVITKNLRMCGDCHSGTKILSKLERRKITVRDGHRIHHFQNGMCSCGDYI